MNKKLLALATLTAVFIGLAPNALAKSSLEVEAFDTIAGYATTIDVDNAYSYRDVEVMMTKPNGSDVILDGETGEEGELKIDVDSFHLRLAGNYEIKARYDDDTEYGRTDSFKVYEDSVSINKSLLAADTVTAEASGYDPVKLTVTLADKYGNPIDGHTVNIISSRSSDYVTPYTTNQTDVRGEVTFYAYSDEVGISTFTAYDVTSNTTLTQRAKVAFFKAKDMLNEIGGDNLFTSVLLAAEGDAGPVDHFEIEDIDLQIEVNKLVNFTVTAYDEDDIIVEDYTGEIRFSSTDDNADLPSDYTFLAEDQGSHTFSLSLRFGTTGTHTLSIADSDDRDIEGEMEIQVVAVGGDEYVADDDDEPVEVGDGTLTMLNPQPGTYSSTTIEVSGESVYGYYIDILDGASVIETVFTNPDGTFETEVTLASGSHDISLEAKDADGLTIGTTESISVNVDTDAPVLDYITVEPLGDLTAGSTFVAEVYSEPELHQVGVIMDDKLYELQESMDVNGLYEGTLAAPSTEDLYSLDVILVDVLGNEIQYSDEATVNVIAASEEVEETEEEEETPTEEETEEAEEPAEETPTVYPTDVTGVESINGEGKVTLTWEAAESGSEDTTVDHYKIYYGPDPELLFSTVETWDSSTTWYIPNLSNGTSYYFQVVAVDSEGMESLGKSLTVSGTPAVAEPEEESMGTLHAAADLVSVDETGTPDETPESGPNAAWILLATMLFSQSYFLIKKKVVQA